MMNQKSSLMNIPQFVPRSLMSDMMCWGIFLIVGKCFEILKDRYLYNVDLVESADDKGFDLPSALKTLEGLPDKVRGTPLVRTLLASLRRYLITQNVQDTSDATRLESGEIKKFKN
jgi:hypothetical protein